MPFHSIEPRRLYRQIADQIRTLIKSGEFPAGARLPPERDLAKQLGVSRPSVREALIALEVEGLVEVRIGSGIYVQPGNEEAADGKTHEAGVENGLHCGVVHARGARVGEAEEVLFVQRRRA